VVLRLEVAQEVQMRVFQGVGAYQSQPEEEAEHAALGEEVDVPAHFRDEEVAVEVQNAVLYMANLGLAVRTTVSH
jgi:hypothetical protein